MIRIIFNQIVEDDLQYTHYDDYPDFYGYGGIYGLSYYEDKTCFHFHTTDDSEFEGNEEFAIKLYSFTPLTPDILDTPNITSLYSDPYDLLFNFTDDYDYDYHHDDHHFHHGHHDHHDDSNNGGTCGCGYDFLDYFYESFSVRNTFNTLIPEEFRTIHVTIVDNDEGNEITC